MLNIMFKLQLIIHKLIFLLFKVGHPFGIFKWSDENGYLKIYEKCSKKNYVEIDKYEMGHEKKIDYNWINQLALQTQVVIKKSEINYQHGRVLYAELCSYIKKNSPDKLEILETGTARGFSSVCMSRAIQDSNYNGQIHTIDILPNNKKIYWNSISDISGKKTRLELLQKWNKYLQNIIFYKGNSIKVLNKININRVNFAFLDGSHNRKKVEFEFNWVKKRQLKNDIIVFDDYDPINFKGICEFVDELEIKKIYKIMKVFSEKNRGYAIAYKL